MPEPRVLHVITDLDRGGAQETLRVLAEHPRARDRMVVCALRDGPLRAALDAAGVRVRIVPTPTCRFWNVPRYAGELARIAGALRATIAAERVDVVQTHLLNVFDAVVLGAARGARRPAVVWTIHGPDYLPARPGAWLGARRAFCLRLYRALAPRVDALVCVSDSVRSKVLEDLPRTDPGKARVIGNVPSQRKWMSPRSRTEMRGALALLPGARVVLFVGRLALVKGCDRLLAAAPKVLARVPGAVFLIAGDGPERRSLEARAACLGIERHCRFLGERDDIADLLAASDAYCLPSREEGRSVALLEAMSSGVPVVVSDLPSNREIVTDRRTGFVVSTDDADAFAMTLSNVLLRPDEARPVGRAGAAVARMKYCPSHVYAAYDALYAEILRPSTAR